MEEHVGMIANNPNYKLEELERLYADVPGTGIIDESAKYTADHDDVHYIAPSSAPGTAINPDVLERRSDHLPIEGHGDDH
jgi:hypothetical protein